MGQYRGALVLRGLREIPVYLARYLVQHGGYVDVSGVSYVSDETAFVFRDFPGTLRLG